MHIIITIIIIIYIHGAIFAETVPIISIRNYTIVCMI